MIKRTVKFSIFSFYYTCYYYGLPCLLQCGVNCNSFETISTERWKQLETKTKDWKGLDNFEKRAEGLHVHERCCMSLSSKLSLQLSQKRKEKENAEKNFSDTWATRSARK